jgi:hypothetical protein
VPELWTPLSEGPHEEFVDRLYRAVARFAEEKGVEKPLVELELNDTARFVIDRIAPEPGFGMVTIYVHPSREEDGPEAIVVPIGSIRRIELRAGSGERVSRFGFSLPGTANA